LEQSFAKKLKVKVTYQLQLYIHSNSQEHVVLTFKIPTISHTFFCFSLISCGRSKILDMATNYYKIYLIFLVFYSCKISIINGILQQINFLFKVRSRLEWKGRKKWISFWLCAWDVSTWLLTWRAQIGCAQAALQKEKDITFQHKIKIITPNFNPAIKTNSYRFWSKMYIFRSWEPRIDCEYNCFQQF